MTRTFVVLLAGVVLAGAGPRTALPLPPPLPLALPLPPPLPTHPPADLAAPVPDGDPHIPAGFAQDDSTSWALRVYRMQEFGTGDGYIPGSAYQAPEQRKLVQTPGFMVTVPLR